MRQILLVLTLFTLAACQTTGDMKVASCKGPAFPLNSGHWQATKADIGNESQAVSPPGLLPSGVENPAVNDDRPIIVSDPEHTSPAAAEVNAAPPGSREE